MAVRGPGGGGRGGRLFRPRLAAVALGAVAMLVLLALRLFVLQVRRGEELAVKGRRNFVQERDVPHDRGIIYDRRGRILADNRPSLDVQVTPAFLGRGDAAAKSLGTLAEVLGLGHSERARLGEAVAERRGLARFQPLTVRRDLSAAEVEAVEARRSVFLLDGVDIVEGRKRNYPFAHLAAHVLGYTNGIDLVTLAEQRARGNPGRYRPSCLIGREGVERTYEAHLRGEDGVEKVVVDAKGRRQNEGYVAGLLGEGSRRAPRPGHNLYLTVDLDLQEAAERALAELGQAGSVVALDPRDGAVRALVSWPAYDVNAISGLAARQLKERMDADPFRPWLNRAIQGQYAPGSTFKPVTALAALAARVAPLDEAVFCPGSFRLGRHSWRCWRDTGHGGVDLRQAMKVSCDTFFYTLGHRTGIDPVAQVARALGLGAKTGIALGGEQAGLVPDEAFHDRVDRATGGYQRGMAINTAIGQGATLVTPLQLAVAYAALADEGVPRRPQLVERITTADFRVTRRRQAPQGGFSESIEGEPPRELARLAPEPLGRPDLAPAALARVRRGLEAVTGEPGGTGYLRRSRQISMAGKSGTAQVVRLGRERLKRWQVDYGERDHAWFVAYAPVDQPRLVVAVLNEHGGHGSSAAMPVAVAVIDAFVRLEGEPPAGPPARHAQAIGVSP